MYFCLLESFELMAKQLPLKGMLVVNLNLENGEAAAACGTTRKAATTAGTGRRGMVVCNGNL